MPDYFRTKRNSTSGLEQQAVDQAALLFCTRCCYFVLYENSIARLRILLVVDSDRDQRTQQQQPLLHRHALVDNRGLRKVTSATYVERLGRRRGQERVDAGAIIVTID